MARGPLLSILILLSTFSCSRGAKDSRPGTNESDRKLATSVLEAYDEKLLACWNDSLRARIDDFPAAWYLQARANLESALLYPTENGLAHLTPSGASSCADALTQASCPDVESEYAFHVCLKLRIWEGSLGVDAACEHHGECESGYCRHGYRFESDPDVCGRCAAIPQGEGAPCHEWPCDEGLECSAAGEEEPICTPISARGPSCGWNDECKGDEVCAESHCGPPPVEGEPCASEWPNCAADLGCPEGQCEAALATGDACTVGTECALNDWCIDGVCSPRPLAGEACSDDLPCRGDTSCLTNFGDGEYTVPVVCIPGGALATQEDLLLKLRGDAFCEGCPPIEIVEEGPCDVYAGPRVCKNALSTRYCAAAAGEVQGECADRPTAGDTCDRFAAPCSSPSSVCWLKGICEPAGQAGESCEDAPCGYGTQCNGSTCSVSTYFASPDASCE